jgi:mono/diheme cytochrome c family protein
MKIDLFFKSLCSLAKRLIVPILAVVVYACVHDPFPATPPPTEVNPGNTYGGTTSDCKYQGICFESSVLPIFVSTCAKSGCHDANSNNDYNLSTYATILRKGIVPGNANQSKLYKVTGLSGEDQMPPAPNARLTQAQRDSIAKWINEGAKNTVKCNCSCDTTKFTFSGEIFPMITSYCVGCHSGASSGGGIDLTNYNNVHVVALNNKLVGSITQVQGYSPMPKGSKFSECQIKQVKKWIAAGSLNN